MNNVFKVDRWNLEAAFIRSLSTNLTAGVLIEDVTQGQNYCEASTPLAQNLEEPQKLSH